MYTHTDSKTHTHTHRNTHTFLKPLDHGGTYFTYITYKRAAEIVKMFV